MLVELMYQLWSKAMKVNPKQVETLLFDFVGMCYNETTLLAAPAAQVQQ